MCKPFNAALPDLKIYLIGVLVCYTKRYTYKDICILVLFITVKNVRNLNDQQSGTF